MKDDIRTSYPYYSVRRIDAEPNSINRQRLCKGKVAALFIDGPHLVDTKKRGKARWREKKLFVLRPPTKKGYL